MENSNPGVVILRVQAILDSLKSAERTLADYILKHTEDVVHLTIQELERKSGISYATIIRFCKKIGFSGYKDFRNHLIQDAIQNRPPIPPSNGLPIQSNDNIETIIEKTFSSSYQILQETQQIIDASIISEAVDKITNAREIYFVGTGTSGITAHYAFTRFFRIGIHCSSEVDATLLKIKTSILRKNDVLFAISSSGRSKNIVDAARIANENEVTVISLCDYAISPLSRVSSVNLFTTPRNTTQFLDMEMPLFIGQINIIDILFLGCCLKMGKSAFDQYQVTKCVGDMEKQ